MIEVRAIPSADAYYLLTEVHYARRLPSISHAFAAFASGEQVGVITYGCPPSAPLRRGLCGEDWKGRILELNRLCMAPGENIPNRASYLISASLKLLPTPRVIISFADTAQGHRGVVYQAANFLYCGLSAKRTDWKVRGKEHLHGQTIADEFRGQTGRAAAMREKYGERFYLAPRPRKHRYVYFLGSRGERAAMKRALRYQCSSYPKQVWEGKCGEVA